MSIKIVSTTKIVNSENNIIFEFPNNTLLDNIVSDLWLPILSYYPTNEKPNMNLEMNKFYDLDDFISTSITKDYIITVEEMWTSHFSLEQRKMITNDINFALDTFEKEINESWCEDDKFIDNMIYYSAEDYDSFYFSVQAGNGHTNDNIYAVSIENLKNDDEKQSVKNIISKFKLPNDCEEKWLAGCREN